LKSQPRFEPITFKISVYLVMATPSCFVNWNFVAMSRVCDESNRNSLSDCTVVPASVAVFCGGYLHVKNDGS
jgi:hypothetical protein